MPRGDGSGPMGMGPMTGRAAGYCAGYGVPGYMNPVGGGGFGRGMAWGRGGGFGRGMAWGRGRRWGFQPPAYPPAAYGPAPAWGAPSAEDEMEALRSQAGWLKEQMEAVNRRIDELQQKDE